MRKVSSIVGFIILSGCGSGGEEQKTNNVVAQSTSNYTTQSPRFTEISNALHMENPFSSTITKIEPIDISGDGRDDLVIHQWAMGPNENRGDTPCPNVLKVYILQPDNTFADQTSVYVQGTTDLGGCSRKLRIADLNNDNKSDIVFAMNNEDGRVSQDVSDFNVRNFALISEGALYKGRSFGIPNWYHAVGVGYDKDNKPFVMGAGYTGSDNNAYYFDQTKNHNTVSKEGLESLSPNTFEFFSKNNTKKHTEFLLQGSNTFPNFGSTEGFIQDSSGSWEKVGEFAFASVIGIANGVSWNTTPSQIPVFKYKEFELAFAGLSDSCKLKLTPNSEPIVVFGFSGQRVTNDWKTTTIIEGGKSMSFFVAATIVNNEVQEVPLNIQGEIVDVHGEFECKDINGDGYDDILRYPHSRTGVPYIYLNDKNNGFKFYEQTNLPSVTTGWDNGTGNNATSIVNDFDKDGYPDILIYPHWNVQGVETLKYKFYKGQRPL